MLFSDPLFIFGFLPVVYCAWLLLRFMVNRELPVLILLILASLAFYSWPQAQHTLLLVGSILFNWIAGACITRSRQLNALAISSFAVAVNLLLLAVA